MASMAEAVIFDLDEVLCDYDFADRLQRLSELCGLDAAEIELRIWTSGFDGEADRGRYSLAEYCRLTCKKLEADLSYEALLGARIGAMRRKEDVLALVRTLKGQVKLALLTNNGPFLAQGIRQILPEIDDTLAYLLGAQSAGLATHQYVDPSALEAFLASQGFRV